jgi:hypothetical protein
MKNIRQAIFETNSSSSHSISFIGNQYGMYDTIHPDSDGKIHLEGGEFGWGPDTLTNPLSKASYCAVDAFFDRDKLDMLKKVICDHTGAIDVIFDFSILIDGPNWSYIDHQSCGTSYEYFESEQKLKDLIFDTNYLINIESDG